MKSIPSFLSTLALTSILCAGAASLVIAAPMPANDEGQAASESDQPVTDTWITTKVKSELAATDGVKSMDISVETVNGVVTLIGVQDTEQAVERAVAAARSVKGVKRVDASGLKARS
ncbi:BON domain-containing protein [Dokdonella sp.]|uniref:BON domain-containing protein n=1 Tax=Dokdonella sp. TaxID=2291710 RepID=UPI0031C2F7AC|nr:BON domain-containing protein [Dokdonella sp.]